MRNSKELTVLHPVHTKKEREGLNPYGDAAPVDATGDGNRT